MRLPSEAMQILSEAKLFSSKMDLMVICFLRDQISLMCIRALSLPSTPPDITSDPSAMCLFTDKPAISALSFLTQAVFGSRPLAFGISQ